jgi:N12 class adenine-specific DNA methylase
MRIKTWDLLRRRRKVAFLTATPIMNTIGEAYVMQLYLQEHQLETVGIHHFERLLKNVGRRGTIRSKQGARYDEANLHIAAECARPAGI